MRTGVLERVASAEVLLALVCMGSTPACSPGAPETVSESGATVPEFGTGVPGRGFGAANGGSGSAAEASAPTGSVSPEVPAGGDAVGPASGSGAGATNTATEGAPVSDLDPGSAVDSNSGSNTPPDPDPDPDPATDADPATGGVGSASCALDVTVTTRATTGRYSPRNVGAIWIADSSDRFIKSLDVWGNRRLEHVTAWNSTTESAGVAGNKVDAVTSATLTAHRAHDVSWNCLDYAGQPVPDGSYRVFFELTEANGSGPNHFESFDKGPSAVTVEGTTANFNGIVLTFTP